MDERKHHQVYSSVSPPRYHNFRLAGVTSSLGLSLPCGQGIWNKNSGSSAYLLGSPLRLSSCLVLLGIFLITISWGAYSPPVLSTARQLRGVHQLVDPDIADSGALTRRDITLRNGRSTVTYKCYEPIAGLSSPVLTVLTISTLPEPTSTFLHRNRAHYALKHGYRFCEQSDIADPDAKLTNIPYVKLPSVLALLPCSDYVIHVDADAIFINNDYSFTPWMKHMEENNLDLLLSKDYADHDTINFGVFMVRPNSWVYDFFKTLYNTCLCDWGRTNQVPAEQGLLYDLLVQHRDSEWFNHTEVVSWEGWNRHIWKRDISARDLVVHYAGVGPRDGCQDKFPGSCRYDEIIGDHEKAVKGGFAHSTLEDPSSLLKLSSNMCIKMHRMNAVKSLDTYHYVADNSFLSSAMDWTVDEEGKLSSVDIMMVPCTGKDRGHCSVPVYWNAEKKPWMVGDKNLHQGRS